jgi:CDP-6-deoxy-D-xylo-4-hexulose-3-dehydrase
MAGFDVKLIDIDPSTLNFDLEIITKSITKKTKAIFIVHLLGNVGKVKELAQICKDRNIILLEDCCEALGSKYSGQYVGTFGLASSYSFFFSHHLVTMEGGMILTRDANFAKKIRLLRSHGWAREIQDFEVNLSSTLDNKYTFLSWGFNLRPTEIQAGFGIEQIQKIDNFHAARVKNSHLLLDFVSDNSDFISTMDVDPVTECSWFSFPIIIKKNAPFSKADFANHLEKLGVESRPIVIGNLARQPAVKNFTNIIFEELPGADHINDFGLYLGIHPNTKSKDLKKAIKVMNNYLSSWRING